MLHCHQLSHLMCFPQEATNIGVHAPKQKGFFIDSEADSLSTVAQLKAALKSTRQELCNTVSALKVRHELEDTGVDQLRVLLVPSHFINQDTYK